MNSINAIIMAAGMSSRFAPLSYEIPKGLLKVKNEVLIERQIKQLQEKGINDITVVTGYKASKFEYLKDQFGVELVYNKDYFRYNNTSSLMLVLDKLKNTYICSSDNYFEENLFNSSEIESYYYVQEAHGISDEYFVKTDEEGTITDITFDEGIYYMIGHAYFNEETSTTFKEILTHEYAREDVKEMLWEKLYLEFIESIKLKIRIDENKSIFEFDNFNELRSFDNYYVNYPENEMLNNISNYFQVPVSEIVNIKELKEGLTNLSFKFDIGNKSYVYRHPGEGTEKIISRDAERFAQEQARALKIDKSFVYMDKEKGYKISHYIKDCRILNYHSEYDLKVAMKQIKRLHDAKIKSEFDSNLWNKTLEMLQEVSESIRSNYNNFDELYDKMESIYKSTEDFLKEKYLCHCDFFNTNILFKDKESYIIDWEYAGNDDPAADLGIFVASSDMTVEQALKLLEIYEGTEMEESKYTHFVSYYAIASYYCFIWALYQQSKDQNPGSMLDTWYESTLVYSSIV